MYVCIYIIRVAVPMHITMHNKIETVKLTDIAYS